MFSTVRLTLRLAVIGALLVSGCGGSGPGASGGPSAEGNPSGGSNPTNRTTQSATASAANRVPATPGATPTLAGQPTATTAPPATAVATAAKTAAATAAPTVGSTGTSTATGTYPDIVGGGNGSYPQLMIDATGTRHFLYQRTGVDPTTGTSPLRYGECSADCTSAAGWSFVSLGDLGSLGGFGKLALTPSGQPRLVWASVAGIDSPYVLNFASCDLNCTTVAAWTGGAIKTLGSFEVIYTDATRNLAVDGSGRVHLVYFAGSKLHYETCPSNCQTAAAWSEVLVGDDDGRASLAVTPAGQVGVAITTAGSQELVYLSCNGTCDQPANWSPGLPLYASNRGQVSLRLDAQGRPRILYNEANAGQPNFDDLPLAAWCNAGCGTVAGWSGRTLGLAAGDGRDGLDFDLDQHGDPVAAFQSAKTELVILHCTACWTADAVWNPLTVETTDTLAAEVAPPLPTCSSGSNPVAYWYPGEQASVAMNPVTHLLEVAHRAYTLTKCFTGDNVIEGVSIPRYSGGF